ncbi:MAG: hypothetical protein KBC94_27945 [Pseudacidovorax sp.]|uniref:hypothetical protein n=1 Tax=Pseudacidovorax sp. TaxID=1934311 RepID=UPI001B4A4120|nr:hypothetical protein [Pseudacidovorax sp.]MBP6898269.1 hypothetical protein [Pseudacidovorax sp.]
MKKLFIALLAFCASTNSLSKDGFISEFHLKTKRTPNFIYGIIERDGAKIYSLKISRYEKPFADITLLDLEKDGYPEIETTGLCAQTCEHEIYKMINGKYKLVFSGTYMSITFKDGYYILRESSGCCLEGINLYDQLTSIKSRPAFTFLMERNGDEDCESQIKKIPLKYQKHLKYICKS